jgi:galactonate dehydratase
MEVRRSPTENLGFDNRDWFPVQVQQEGDRLIVPETPGLGVEFNEEMAAAHTFRFGRHWTLHRRDGSYTNS